MSAIDRAAQLLRDEAQAIKGSHTLGGRWLGDPAEADHDALLAAASAAVAERNALLDALQRIADGQEVSGTYTFGDVVLRYQEIARAAIAKATGEQS